MNHVAFTVPPERIDEYRDRLVAAGVACTEVANHDDSEWGIADDVHPGVFVRSVYFQDPDGILLELACWTVRSEQTTSRTGRPGLPTVSRAERPCRACARCRRPRPPLRS